MALPPISPRTGGTLDVTLGNTPATTSGAVARGSYGLTGDMTVHQTKAGNYTLTMNGNDTVYLGAGNDTINQLGASTLYGGSGKLNYTGGLGADSIMAGSGAATILGGGGFDTIIGGSNLMKADGGDGNDLLVGGSFKDTLTGGTGGDLFRFAATAHGGQHVITDFIDGSDKIDLTGGGYTLADISQTSIKAGSTIIKLSDGTQITLKNFKSLDSSDFI
jgi:Ca2+-binding RTX toxin-like protein